MMVVFSTSSVIIVGYGLVMNCWDFRLNPNLAYQGIISSTDKGIFAGYTGGGMSLGEINSYAYNNCIGGVFGINALVGVEYAFNQSPISFGFDFRPGYGYFLIRHMPYLLLIGG